MLRYFGHFFGIIVLLCPLLGFAVQGVALLLPRPAQLAFAVRRSDTTADVYVVDLDRGLTAPLISGIYDRALSFAPDGALVYSRYIDSDHNLIFSMDSSGHETQLSPDAVRDQYPLWSHDGNQVAFMTIDEANSRLTLYAMNRDGSERRNLSRQIIPYANTYPVWLPDDTRIMYGYVGAEQNATYLVNSLTGDLFNFTYSTGIRALPAWSPDGRRIAYVLYASMYASVYVAEVNADGSVVHGTITEMNNSSRSYNTYPRWSPDSQRIAYVSDVFGAPEIYAMNYDGTHNVNLSQNGAASDTFPAWSPDGTRIAFISNRDGVSQIYVMNADGSNQRRVSAVSGDLQISPPTWLP
ncbi:MAG: hypothetical protein U0694_07985 [Anaerolineae bacterium]